MRLVTRGDLDGLTCAVLICLNERIDDIWLIHPQDITDERVEIEDTDILANLPYHPNCAMWFDHHQHTATLAAPAVDFKGAFGYAPSAARLVYEYYGGEETLPQYAHLVQETDRLDSANLTAQDVESPQGFILLGFTIDGRSGLGAFEAYFMTLVSMLIKSPDLDPVMSHPEVHRRCEALRENIAQFRRALLENSWTDGNVVITDFRSLDAPPTGNRFLVYALFPQVNVSIRVQWGPEKKWAMCTIGHSIINRTCRSNVGELAARYGGGGHQGAGSIPLIEDDPDQQIKMIIAELKAIG